MAFEFSFFRSPVAVGRFNFFDLMDTVGSPARKSADVVTFTAPTAQSLGVAVNDSTLKSAA